MNEIKTICVCGAGTMGSGIAQVSAMAGYDTIQFDLNVVMLDKSRSLIIKNLDWLLNKGKITEEEKKACLQNICFTSNIQECFADLMIEAIIEKKEAKTELFNQLATINNQQVIFATNTSSISVTEIASQMQDPSRVVGMHFFNPAPVMKLVEVVKATHTVDSVIQKIIEVAEKMRKVPVVCKDAPGFIVNRVARPYFLEAMKLLEEGYATIETIDVVMESAGFKMGPFKLMDLIGMDINYGVSNIVWEALGKPERLKPSQVQKQKVESGELGRKTGKGFYAYDKQ